MCRLISQQSIQTLKYWAEIQILKYWADLNSITKLHQGSHHCRYKFHRNDIRHEILALTGEEKAATDWKSIVNYRLLYQFILEPLYVSLAL